MEPGTYQWLTTPATWITYDADGVITNIHVESDARYDILFAVPGREWGPYTVEPGVHDFSVPKGWGKRFEDIQTVAVIPRVKDDTRLPVTASVTVDGFDEVI